MSGNQTLTAGAAAEYVGMSLDTFRKARKSGNGPVAFLAHGGRARFARSVLDDWMASRRDADPLAPKKKGRTAA